MSAVLTIAEQHLMCESKRRHWSRIDALIAAKRRTDAVKGLKLRVYQCLHCDGWHLTSKPKFSGTSRQRESARRPR